MPADISTTIIKNGATVTPTTTVPGQNATVTFTGVATDPPYTLSLGPSIAVPVLDDDHRPERHGGPDTFGTPDPELVVHRRTDRPAPFQIPVNGTYTIKVDYVGNGVGAIPMSLIG